MACVVNVSRTRERHFCAHVAHVWRTRACFKVFYLQEYHNGYAQAACHPLVRPFRRATVHSQPPVKHGFWGSRVGPVSGLGRATALRGYTLSVCLTPRHPTSHVTSRACPHDAHFMPSCMRCLHALRGRSAQARISPPRAAGLVSSIPGVVVLPSMAGFPDGVRPLRPRRKRATRAQYAVR